jgi:hypothetical protein
MMVLPPILFEIPPDLQAQVLSGVYRRVGALILDNPSGRIVAHVQQTGLAADLSSQLLRSAPSALSTFASPVGIASALVSYSQNQSILRGIELLQNLQMVDLLLGGLDLGVNLAGHAVTSARLSRLQSSVQAIDDRLARVESRIEDLHGQAIRDDLLLLDATCKQVDDGWLMGDPSRSWSAASDALYGLQERFNDRAAAGLAALRPAFDRVEVFLDAAALASTVQISVRTAMRDMAAARAVASRAARRLLDITGKIGRREILEGLVDPDHRASTALRINALEMFKDQAMATTTRFRMREEQIGTAVPVLDSLIAKGVDGRAWLEQLRGEKGSPFVLVDHLTTF